MFNRIQLSSGLLYASAVVAIVVTTGVLYLLRDALGTPIIALFYLLPVGVSAMWGLGPGVAAAICAFLAFNFFFIPPFYTFGVHHTQDVLVLIVFFIVALAISQLVGRAQSSRAMAEAREREATYLYTLTTSLAGLRTETDIAHTLADHLQDILHPATVEVVIQPSDRAPVATCHTPSDSPTAGRPDHVAPLVTPRGKMGEIRLWQSHSLSPTDERLLHASANQGALAVERMALAQAETRAEVLGESDRLKSALLSSVSHELRTPLATIKAAATSLRSGDVPWESEARAELLAAVDEEVDLMNRLVGNLLDMSRIESGAFKPKREWNIMGEIINGVAARMQRTAQRHRFDIDVPDDLPLAPVDYVQMEQLLTNLISNSLKYAPPGTTVCVCARVQDTNTLTVQVSNEGPHVPPEHLERIFDKFYRVTAADRVTGTGLGLSICKGIVEAHGGRIWAENLPDRFAFNFTLPLTLDGAPPPSLPVETDSE
ncbi:MAG: ATP-binding protein [Chloroflexota bacterium]|jgi:two-component system sensor histidine kinase KdpD